MSTLPPLKPGGMPLRSNPDRVASADLQSLNITDCWLGSVRRYSSLIPFFVPLRQATAGVSNKRTIPLSVPSFCKRIQWGMCAIGQGTVYVHASAAPASETYETALEVQRPYTTFGENEEAIWTMRQCKEPVGAAHLKARPLLVTSSSEGAWETQEVLVWIVDDPTGSYPVRLKWLEFVPLPRVAADGTLV